MTHANFIMNIIKKGGKNEMKTEIAGLCGAYDEMHVQVMILDDKNHVQVMTIVSKKD